MEHHFLPFRQNIAGIDALIQTPYGQKPLVYADWTASGRIYTPIEEKMAADVYPFVANTHTDTNYTGSFMTLAYHTAMRIIKEHVGASGSDVIISSNSGMTGVVNKFQRILGLKIHERYRKMVQLSEMERPVIFCTHMEHHSNQTSWLETLADVVIIEPDKDGLVDLNSLDNLLEKYSDRKMKIAAVTSCSNVSGVFTPYYEIAKRMHRAGGYCFVDFACSAPYIDIDMHPEDPEASLDAIYFSPHKFLGGTGTAGVLVFNSKLYNNKVPDHPGGGTVDYTNPWGEHKYVDDIEAREDGGTPAFLQTIKFAQCVKLKEEMDTRKIKAREEEIVERVWERLNNIPGLHIMAGNIKERLPVFSFYIDNLHYNLAVRMLNDRFGIQTRGGCSCAGTYGHYLLHIYQDQSEAIYEKIKQGNLTDKPGWVRMSLHPTNTNEEIDYILQAIEDLALHFQEWAKDYICDYSHNSIRHIHENENEFADKVRALFIQPTGNTV